jgi:hypothetical protein
MVRGTTEARIGNVLCINIVTNLGGADPGRNRDDMAVRYSRNKCE